MKSTVPKLAWDTIDGFEGNPLRAYWDIDRWRIGRAIDGPDINQNTIWTAEKSDFEFGKKLNEEAAIICPHIEPELSDPQLAACESIEYNIGPDAFLASTLLKLVNQRDFQGAANEFPKWCHSEGSVNANLLARREKEKALFLSGTQPEPTPAPTPQPTPAPVPLPAPSGGTVNPIKKIQSAKALTKTLVGIVIILGSALQDPTVQATIAGYASQHKGLASAIAAIAAIAALMHEPQPKQ